MENSFLKFGSKLYSFDKLKNDLPHPIHIKWLAILNGQQTMDEETADAVAHAMKTWALDNGATHYSHWFHPMTGSSAEKHDAFLEPGDDDAPIARFSGKNLIKGETDGSSFPNGGLRQTFEARGYTYWDISSPVFIRGHVLFIPSLFISFNGHALDEKVPLLKAMTSLSTHATRVLHALGDKSVRRVDAMIGLEQEYFLIEASLYEKREDLQFTNRTLFGEPAPKNQELESHYYSDIPSAIIHYMEDVNDELWQLGIYAKVEHNEVAPSQYEIVTHFTHANIAIDQNMLVMETLQRVARKHNFICNLHEKPFYGINGSGKHNNFSLVTDSGFNLFEPGEKPQENIRFLVFVTALMSGIDRYQSLLRFAASSSGNDHRLGGHEAPPTMISLYLGDALEDIMMRLKESQTVTRAKQQEYIHQLSTFGSIVRDNSDRNRTAPFAFTGNKFEFRMPGSAMCSAFVNTTICTLMAQALKETADVLENTKYVNDARDKAMEYCQMTIKEHQRILYSGDNYHRDWQYEGSRRGLYNVSRHVEAIRALEDENNRTLFLSLGIFTEEELNARQEIAYSQHIARLNTEVNVMLRISKRDIIPALISSLNDLQPLMNLKNTLIEAQHNRLLELLTVMEASLKKVENIVANYNTMTDIQEKAHYMDAAIPPELTNLAQTINLFERIGARNHYPFPTYADMLFNS